MRILVSPGRGHRQRAEPLNANLCQAGIRGVHPALQRRSRETQARLITHGRELLKNRSLDELSIEDLCLAADCRVGAFYSRFASKEAFFSALQFVVCRDRDHEIAATVESVRRGNWSLEQICEVLIGDLVRWYRENRGVLRASLQQSGSGESAWSPIKELGTRHKQIWLGLLGPCLSRLKPRDRYRRIMFANQVANGTLVHMLLNDPGPIKLDQQAAIDQLSSVIITYLSANSEISQRTESSPLALIERRLSGN